MLPSNVRVLLCATPVDMRRSFDSLARIVIERLDEDPTRGDLLFVFVNAARDKVKLMWRDASGVCLVYKRWDDDTAALPEIADGATRVVMDMKALGQLLVGTPMTTAVAAEPTAKTVARAAKSSAEKWMAQQLDQGRQRRHRR